MDLDRADGVLASIKVSELIPVTQEVARLAVELRQIQNLDIIDACIGATTCYLDAILLTNDQRLLRHPVVPALPFPIPEITKEDNK
jgi:predicted nucleic acid-binding protein